MSRGRAAGGAKVSAVPQAARRYTQRQEWRESGFGGAERAESRIPDEVTPRAEFVTGRANPVTCGNGATVLVHMPSKPT